MQAHAVVATHPGRVEYRAVTVPEPGPEEVVLRITHSWISNGTEGSFVRGERIAGDTPRADSDLMPFPHVPGYQKVGVVEWVGAAVRDLAVGDTVFAATSRVDGMFYGHGGHISPAVTHRSQIWKLPPGLDPVAASGLVLTQVGYNVGIRPQIGIGDAALVLGDGMVGHWAAQTLQFRGARVLLAGKHDERLSKFKARPGDRIVNITRENLLDVAKAWAPSRVQALADTVGTVPDLEALFPVMRHNSHLVSAGFCGPNGRIDIQKMRNYEMTLHAPAGWAQERMDATLDLLHQGALQTLPLITHRFPVQRAAEAFDLILSRREPVLGVVLDWE
jgi:2-desacetyl-2-hydroxyethyl bacteriochlorophyllide A dehydrogenase